MRKLVCLATALVLAVSGAARAEKKDECQAVIEKAIKATGGAENLAKVKAFSCKLKGKFYGMGEGVDYTGEWAVQQPHKLRVQIDSEAGGMKFTFIRVVNGDKVWNKFNDQIGRAHV